MAIAIERTLTTILCADVEGYSAHMGRDEVGTFETLQRHRAAMRALIERHRGHLVNTWGDGLIAAFPSVVEAVLCAVETQRELRTSNDGLDAERRLLFRIGINLGDVMIQDGDLYGEGVNIAARLQGLAEPGGIVISGTVYDHVRSKLTVGFDFAGHQRVKNITEAVPAFHVRLEGRDGREAKGAPARALRTGQAGAGWRSILARQRGLRLSLVLAGFLLLLNVFTGLGDAVWFHWPVLVIALVQGLRWARSL